MGVVVGFHARALSESRAANEANRSPDNLARRATLDRKSEAHHSAGIRSRCHHLRTAGSPTPRSEASASSEGHRPMMLRKESLDVIESDVGQLVLNYKAKVSHDCESPSDHNHPMAKDDPAASAYRAAFAARVKSAREDRGFTQAGIAELLGVDQGTYKQYEVRSYLPHHLIPRFCLACGVSLDWLFNASIAVQRRKVRKRKRALQKTTAAA